MFVVRAEIRHPWWSAVTAKPWCARMGPNKSKKHKDVKCYDCLHPPCSNIACKTRKVCRDPTCVSSDGRKQAKAIHAQEINVFTSKAEFVCQACLFPSCATCNSEMSKKTKENKRKSDAWMNSRQQRKWTCFECETRANFHRK